MNTRQPHPQRCTWLCNHYEFVSPDTDCGGWVKCRLSGLEITMQQFLQMETTGCASHSSSPAPVPKKALIFVPMSSTELLVMADKEWTNREERKHRHDKASWISGWLDGYFSKPVTIDEHDEQIRQRAAAEEREKVLVEIIDRLLSDKSGLEANRDSEASFWRSTGLDVKINVYENILKYVKSLRSGEGVQR